VGRYGSLVVFSGMPLIEKVHPLQGGYLSRRNRRTRHPGSPPEIALLFWRVNNIRRRVIRDHKSHGYTEIAIARLPKEEEVRLELLHVRGNRPPVIPELHSGHA
jgi:hypothetical protein